MKTIVLLIKLFFLSFLLVAQDGWNWQNPYLQGNTLRAVNWSPLWAVGDKGTAIRSLGPNYVWEAMNIPTTENLYGVFGGRPLADGSTVPEAEGWVVGTNGVIFHTINSGDTWQRQRSGTTETLYAVSGSLDACVWVCGANGTILKTVDKGETWEKISSNFHLNFYDVDHLHCNEAWLVGEDGVTLSTTDGGESWTSHAVPTSYALFSVELGPAGNYRSCGHAGVIFSSENEGVNWSMGLTNTTKRLNGLDVLNIFGRGYVVGDEGVLLQTSDGGANWTQNGFNDTWWDLYDVAGSMDYPSYAVGQHGLILRSETFGEPFGIINKRFLHWVGAIEFLDENNGWAAGGEYVYNGSSIGKVLKTSDGGNTWEEIYSQDAMIFDMDFVNENTGWLVGRDGLIKRTRSGGVSWTTQESNVHANLNAVSFVDENTGWAVSQYSDILNTTDGGNTWTKQTDPTNNPFHDVFFINQNVGCAVGLGGTILNTKDGGTTWVEASVNASRPFRFASVFFLDENHAWACGIYGSIFLSEDGGANWQEMESGTSSTLESIFFIDEENGWAMGDQGLILRSVDGGHSWFEQRSPVASNFLISSYFLDAENGWLGGEGGTILHTSNGGFSYDACTIMHPGLNLPIQDDVETYDVIYLPVIKSAQDYQLTDIKVIIDTIVHPAVKDLIITLTHEHVTDTLINQLKNGGANLLHTTLTDDANKDVSAGKAPYSGDYKPEHALSVFAGMDPKGEWKLSIRDVQMGNEGVLKAWGIVPSYEKVTSVKDITVGKFIAELECYPNPVSDQLYIQLRTTRPQASIRIFDISGMLKCEFLNIGDASFEYKERIDVSSWKAGVYFCHLYVDGFSSTRKLIIIN